MSAKCELPCDTIQDESKEVQKLSDDETEILSFRFGFTISYLCKEHYADLENK